MNEPARTAVAVHPSTAVYLIVAAFLFAITAMELTVFYVSAMRPVLVPVLVLLSAAKFALVVMFYMHLKYDSRVLSGVFVFALFIATIMISSLILLFTYLSHHSA